MYERSRAVPKERKRERPCFWQCQVSACGTPNRQGRHV